MKKKLFAALGLGIAAATMLSGCGASTPSATSHAAASGRSALLQVGLQQGLPSLNPVLTPISNTVAYSYDPIIFESDSGAFKPDLATSWGYVGSGNTVFHFTLRSDVKFQDGTPVTAAAVANSMNYFLKTPNPNFPNVGQIASVKATGPLTVEIDYAKSFPNAVQSVTQFYGIGLPIGPTGLANPASLETTSDGAGQYTLDSAETTAGSVYTFNANKSYFNQNAIKFDQVALKILSNANSRVNALRSGQLDYATQIPVGQVGASQIKGFQQVAGYTNWSSVQFLNTSSGPLANLDVRKALNFAIDRAAIVSKFYQGLAEPLDQSSAVGTVGYDPALESSYSYNVSKAKSLLAAGGYPKGFSLNLLTNAISDPGGLLSQVVANQLQAVGIKVNLTVQNGTFNQFAQDLGSGKYDAVLYGLFATDLYSTVTQSIMMPKTLLHPGATADPQVEQLVAEAASSPSSTAFASTLQKLNAYITKNALSVPIATEKSIDLAASNLVLPATSYVVQQPAIVAPTESAAIAKAK